DKVAKSGKILFTSNLTKSRILNRSTTTPDMHNLKKTAPDINTNKVL
ncbi:hypothetical protein CLAFUW4_10142, partial [Fulvia fulva]